MAEIARLDHEYDPTSTESWAAMGTMISHWAGDQGLALRDCHVLVPHAQLLPLARRAFVARNGWMPRIETIGTLAQSAGPPSVVAREDLTLDRPIDELTAQRLLARHGWGLAWRMRDPLGFERGAAQLAHMAHAFARCAHTLHPAARDAYWSRVRASLAPRDGPGNQERRLARMAAEWAALAPAPITDRLFEMRPAAWIAVVAAGIDEFTRGLLESAAARIPCAIVDCDRRLTAGSAPGFTVCSDLEEEAQCAAAQILTQLKRGHAPIALIAEDRILVRRVRALLARSEVSVIDETGWKLATTRAAAKLMTLLRAARDDASADQFLDWLKSGTLWSIGDATRSAVASIEGQWRRRRVARAGGLAIAAPDEAEQTVLDAARRCLDRLRAPGARPLASWLHVLNKGLAECGALDELHDDEAGRQVLATLAIPGPGGQRQNALSAASHVTLTLQELIRWVDGAFEQSSFVPSAAGSGAPQVIITPLARAALRPFKAIVFPGADATHLGAAGNEYPLLSDAQAVALGLPGIERRRENEWLALMQLARCEQFTVLRRRLDGAQVLANSPLVERMLALRGRDSPSPAQWHDPRAVRHIAPRPTARSAPKPGDLLPRRLSASSFEALRECPYRFFVKAVLRLREPEELARDLEKRDYGNWLHIVLYRFHAGRHSPEPPQVEIERLKSIAKECQLELQLGDGEFLPFAASFKTLAPRYVEWLHGRESEGERWVAGEYKVKVEATSLDDLELEGTLDRIDVAGRISAACSVLIDYKTGSAEALKSRVREPLEDTQLAFYAAILPPQFPRPVRAGYLPLDSSHEIMLIEHHEVSDSASMLLDGIATDMRRLRQGAGLPALGEGEVCERCEARGLCRRDHWAGPDPSAR